MAIKVGPGHLPETEEPVMELAIIITLLVVLAVAAVALGRGLPHRRARFPGSDEPRTL